MGVVGWLCQSLTADLQRVVGYTVRPQRPSIGATVGLYQTCEKVSKSSNAQSASCCDTKHAIRQVQMAVQYTNRIFNRIGSYPIWSCWCTTVLRAWGAHNTSSAVSLAFLLRPIYTTCTWWHRRDLPSNSEPAINRLQSRHGTAKAVPLCYQSILLSNVHAITFAGWISRCSLCHAICLLFLNKKCWQLLVW